MSVKCPFCQERVNFSRDGICPECDGELSDSQMDSLRRALKKKRKSNQITCELCGEKNSPSSVECTSCGEPFYENSNSYGNSGGIWSKGKILVMDVDAKLPDICIKTNLPAKGNKIEQKLRWSPLWITLLGGALMGLIFSKVAIVHVGISKKWQDRRKKKLWIKYGVALFGFILVPLSVTIMNTAGESEFIEIIAALFIPIGIIMCLVGTVLALTDKIGLYAKKITDDYIFIKGAHKDYVKRFPQWEGE
ncbi:hypothetical protein MNBD_PLANCTO02-1220 [hydrothermal vent metagenome]|uniref:Uncharacterized protein n=1 Tax=hydrothermal vent metagenome TaxID=652676 RepID=A0A3B1DMN0_9ZZZZ